MDNPTTPLTPRPRLAKKGKNPNESHEGGRGGSVAHTLTACCRCRQRKTRCDAGLPRCGPCERIHLPCEYFDSVKNKKISRTWVIDLQDRVKKLEQKLRDESEGHNQTQDAEMLMRGASLVKLLENDDSRFLGPSSGIAMTRLVMELAKRNYGTKSIKEIIPETKAKEIKNKFAIESSKPTSKIYPLISSIAAPKLPIRILTDKLVQTFYEKAQYLLPVLHEPSFQETVRDVYENRPTSAYQDFTLRMVIAISMQKLDTPFAGLADSYYLAALPFLEDAIRPMNLGTLQCFALIAQYSMVTPTRTASYWVVGMATKLCQELGLTEEATITRDKFGALLNPLEIDLRRRLFWIITSFEFGLAHCLGRPSAYAVTHDHVDVKFYLTTDDQYITDSGVLPGSPVSPKKQISIHFIKMRILQAEIRRTLYMKKRPSPNSDQDPWFKQMEKKLEDWVANAPNKHENSGLSRDWFRVRYNTMIVFLYRPSPQVPEPSIRAADLCFDASRHNIHRQLQQIINRSVDLTWIFTQSLFMALNTLLWALSYPEIRKQNPKSEVENHLYAALEGIARASERWPGVESALALYLTLIEACVKAYDGNSEASYVLRSPLIQAVSSGSPRDPHDPASPQPQLLTPSTVHSSLSSPYHNAETDHASPLSYGSDRNEPPPLLARYSSSEQVPFGPDSRLSTPNVLDSAPPPSIYSSHSSYSGIPPFDPTSFLNPLPSPPEYALFGPTSRAPSQDPFYNQNFYLGAIGDQYAPYIQQQFMPPEPLASLDLEQQSELMRTLETDGLTDMFGSMPTTNGNFNAGTYGG